MGAVWVYNAAHPRHCCAALNKRWIKGISKTLSKIPLVPSVNYSMSYYPSGQPTHTQTHFTTQQTAPINVPRRDQRQSRPRASTTQATSFEYQEQHGTSSPISQSNRTRTNVLLILKAISRTVLTRVRQVDLLCLNTTDRVTLSHLILRQESIIQNKDFPHLITDPLILRWRTPSTNQADF